MALSRSIINKGSKCKSFFFWSISVNPNASINWSSWKALLHCMNVYCYSERDQETKQILFILKTCTSRFSRYFVKCFSLLSLSRAFLKSWLLEICAGLRCWDSSVHISGHKAAACIFLFGFDHPCLLTLSSYTFVVRCHAVFIIQWLLFAGKNQSGLVAYDISYIRLCS